MIDNLKQFKEKTISDYIASIDLDVINVEKIKEDLQRLIGEKPGVKLNYKTETLINEDDSKPIKMEKLESMTIIFTYDANVGDKVVPIPVQETFILS